MKKIFFFLGIITLIGFNVYISRKSDSSFKINLELQNVALADGEGGDTYRCYSSFIHSDGGSALKCNTPCCYYKDHIASGTFAGTCTGSFSDC